MSRVDYTNIESSAYQAVFDTINTRSYVSDPRDPKDSKTRTFVYDSDPFDVAINFQLLPYIVLLPPTIETRTTSEDGRIGNVKWAFKLTMATAKDGSSNLTVDTGRRDILQMGDDLFKTFNSLAVRQSLLDSANLSNIEIKKVLSDTVVIDQKKVYITQYTIECNQRMRLTA